MNDHLVKALVCEGRVRLYLAKTTDLVAEAQARFKTFPNASAALGRTLSVASLMGSMLKSSKEMLTIQINGHGPLGTIMVDAEASGNVRGFVSNPQVDTVFGEPGHLNVGAVVGTDGTLQVTKHLVGQDNWTGMVDLVSGEIGEDFAYYFTMSEQTPTAVSVGVLVNPEGKIEGSGAMILQMLPDATETDIAICEHVIEGLKPMTQLVSEFASMEELAKAMFEDAQILETRQVHYHCPCSIESVKKTLLALPKEELKAIIEEDGQADVTCHFCGEHYHMDRQALEALL